MWMITKDYISISSPAEGVGMYDIAKSSSQNVEEMPYKFKLYDDDGELYFEGISSDRESEDAFDPLDWAQADSGCTEIRYLQDNGKWETL